MGFFAKKKTVTILVDDGFLLPEYFYLWMEKAKYQESPESCVWQQLNTLLKTSGFSALLFAKQDRISLLKSTMVMRADPVHIHADWQGLSITDPHPQDLSLSDAQLLGEDIQQDLASFGYTLHCPTAYRWYITADTLVHFDSVPTACATLDKTHIIQQLPDALHQILNQLQINLHHHPVNLAREAAGLETVNSLWCWGVSETANTEKTRRSAQLYSNNPEIKLYAKALAMNSYTLDAHQPNPEENQVLVLDRHVDNALNFETLLGSTTKIHYRGVVYYQ